MENVLYSVMEKEYPEVDYGDGMYLYDTTGKNIWTARQELQW